MEKLLTQFTDATHDYLKTKLPDAPESKILELTENITFAALTLADKALAIQEANMKKWWRDKVKELRDRAKKEK